MMKKFNAGLVLILICISGGAHAHGHEAEQVFSSVMVDRLEVRDSNKTGNSSNWEAQGWSGDELNKLWFKTQGDVNSGGTQFADMQLLYSQAVAAYWDVQLGARHDYGFNGLPSRDYAAVALKGLAPYKFDVDASFYLGSMAAARVKAGYTLLLTQRLAILPELEANWYGGNDIARGVGSGLSNLDFGLRLRYELSREFAPYVGINWANKYGETANFARLNGEPASEVMYVVGIRLWW